MDNLNLLLVSGGYFCCTPEWNAEPYGSENCYKLYFPVEGECRIDVGGEWYELTAGNAYFINGFMLDRNRCEHFMKVFWIHFIPESQLLRMYLGNLKPVFCWKQDSAPYQSFDYTKIALLFDAPDKREKKLLETASLSLAFYVHSMILRLISDMSEAQPIEPDSTSFDLFFKLEPALHYINSHYHQRLTLADMAQKTFLNPVYFLRLFKRCFKTTPNRYITLKRLQEACKLLMKTDMSIQEISERTGFCNQFYFSKVFKSHFRKTPLDYRRTKLSP